LNLETAVGRKTNVEDIGVPGERKKFVVTSVVMRHFFILPGAPRACADFCDPTADSRLNCPTAAEEIRGMLWFTKEQSIL